MHWTTLYNGPSEKVQRQIAVYLHRSGIPYRLSCRGILLKNGYASYRVRIRSGDLSLAVLLLKQHKRKP